MHVLVIFKTFEYMNGYHLYLQGLVNLKVAFFQKVHNRRPLFIFITGLDYKKNEVLKLDP